MHEIKFNTFFQQQWEPQPSQLTKVMIELTNKSDILLPRLGYLVLFLEAATIVKS